MTSYIEKRMRESAETWAQLGFPDFITRFVLKNGRFYENVHAWDGAPGTPKECFSNAMQAAIWGGDDTLYVEGFAYRHGLPLVFHHAWIERNGAAIDPTLKDAHIENVEFFGAAYRPEIAFEEMKRTGYYGLFDTPTTQINLNFMARQDPDFQAEIAPILRESKINPLTDAAIERLFADHTEG